jgi:dihydrofolate synthase/folylpolyglutamate synthase
MHSSKSFLFFKNIQRVKSSFDGSFVNILRKTQNPTRSYRQSLYFSYSTHKEKFNNSNPSVYSPPSLEKLSKLMPDYDSFTGVPYSLYEKCVRRLYLTNLFHPVKLGLQNMEQLHEAIGNPMNSSNITVIHVAGTNGKGSVSFKMAKTLELAGYNVGLFVSPHISSFRERMQINSKLITEEQVEEYLPFIYEICEKHQIPATFFEVTTALAFHYFAKNKVDAVVIETGLGGRLDATNVIQNPDLCIITSIGLEHTRILGDTIELIAKEKAGIIKEGSPILVGPNVPHEVIRQCAVEKKAEKYYTCSDILKDGFDDEHYIEIVDPEGFVDYDIENSRTARAGLTLLKEKLKLNLTEENMVQGLSTRPPCRFEEFVVNSGSIPVKVILDVAHNPDAIDLLVSKLSKTHSGRKMRIVAGFSSDKDLSHCGRTLLSHISDPKNLHLVEAAHPRAAKLEEILQAEPRLKESNFDELDRSITTQVKSAIDIAANNDEILVVCGSVFLMAEAREAIGIDEPRDSKYIAEVAGANLRHGQEFFANEDPEKDAK